MKLLSIIPARGGSKGIPRKNLAKINGRPLIEYSIKAALDVNQITDLIVSTDDKEIADIARELGAQVPFIRPLELATDQAQSAPVVRHAVEFMEKLKGYKYDAVLMLQPTCPLRKSLHIKKALDIYQSSDYDSLVSVVSVSQHPYRMKKLVGDKLINYIDQGFENMIPRQELPEVYIRNGAIYLCSRSVIMDKKVLVGQNCYGLVMNDFESVNIDRKLDLVLAETILREGLVG